jgi:3-hydroxyisobutyrate dehydrogenase-like beta-hydroxyacid dehydrogenase
MKIGFIGLGRMGSAMAANLVKAGYEVTVWNRSPQAMENIALLGAYAAKSLQEVAKSEIIISMLADDGAIECVFIDQGVIDTMAINSIHVNMATVSVKLAARLAEMHAERKTGYISAPVLGRPNVAQAGNLNVLIAGKEASVVAVSPILAVLGQRLWNFGENPVAANAAKLAMNLMIASAIEAMAEAMTLASAYGVERAEFINMATGTLFPVPVYQGYGKLMVDRVFEPAGFKLSLGLKDIGLVLRAAESENLPLPFASILRDNLLEAMAHGQLEMDWASLSLVCSRRSGF